jgi:O-antigen/teichoic acid export membrane protein
MGLSAILRPIYHHAATTDPVRAASDATTVTIRLLVLASAPVTWAVLNAQLVVQIVLGPGWERAILPLQLLLWPSVVFVAADFTDRLFDMHRRQHVLMAVSVIACVVTLAGVVLSTLVFPSVVGLAGTMSAVMLGYSIACLLAVGRLGRVLWRSYRRHALRIASNAAIVVMTALAAGELLDRAAAIASAGAALVLTILEARVAISGIIHNTRH